MLQGIQIRKLSVHIHSVLGLGMRGALSPFPQYMLTVCRFIEHKSNCNLNFYIRGKRIEHDAV